MSVVNLPIEKVFPSLVKGKEIWAQSEPPPEMVWEICPYTRRSEGRDRCLHCPAWAEDPDYGPVQRGCYGIAAEACRIIFAMQKREVR
jgi:hypothetical protein